MEDDILKEYLQHKAVNKLWRRSIFSSLNKKFVWIIYGYCLLGLIEVVLFPSLNVLFGVVCSLVGICVTRYFLCNSNKLLQYPLSTISLLFFCLFFEVMPLPATLLELKPIVYNLRNPYHTFAAVFLTHLVLLLTHTLYTKVTRKKNYLRNVLNRLGFFSSFSTQEIWFLIVGSLCWFAYIMITKGLYGDDNRNVNSSFGFVEWAVSLFFSSYHLIAFIFFFKRFNNIKGNYKIQYLPIALVVLVDFIIGIGTNMRTSAVLVFANGFFLLVLYLIYFPGTIRWLKHPKFVIPAVIAGLFFMGPFQIISKSMVAVRNERSGKNAIDMIKMTNSQKRVEKDKSSNSGSLEWDEVYLSSDMMNRFCSLKIYDESIFHSLRLNSEKRYLMRLSLAAKLADQLPGVIKNRLPLSFNEKERDYSLSDYLHYVSTDGRYNLGGVKIGTLPGLGLGMFGYWFFLLLVPVYFIMFYLFDSLVLLKGTKIIIPLFIFANMLDYAGYFSDRHFYLFEFRFMLRGYWELVIFYLFTVFLVKRLPLMKH